MDVLCLEDLNEFGEETTDPLEILRQDVYHTLLERRGSNLDDLDRGLGLEDRLSGPIDPVALKADIENQLSLDDRVNAVQAKVTRLEEGSYRIAIDIETNDGVLELELELDGQGARLL